MIPETGSYPWAVWDSADDILIVTSDEPLPSQSLEFSDEGPPTALDPYGKVCFELMVDGQAVFTPWIYITVSPMVIPVPLAFSGRYEVFSSLLPGQQIAIATATVDDLEEPPKKPKKPKKNPK